MKPDLAAIDRHHERCEAFLEAARFMLDIEQHVAAKALIDMANAERVAAFNERTASITP